MKICVNTECINKKEKLWVIEVENGQSVHKYFIIALFRAWWRNKKFKK